MGNPPHLVNLPLPVHIQITHPSEPVLLKSYLLQEAFLTIPAISPPGWSSLPFTGPSHGRLPGGHNRVANTPIRGQRALLTRSVTLSQSVPALWGPQFPHLKSGDDGDGRVDVMAWCPSLDQPYQAPKPGQVTTDGSAWLVAFNLEQNFWPQGQKCFHSAPLPRDFDGQV